MAWHGVQRVAGQGGAVRVVARWAVSHRGAVCGGAVQCASCGRVWCGVQWHGSVRGVQLPDGSCRIVAWCGVCRVVGVVWRAAAQRVVSHHGVVCGGVVRCTSCGSVARRMACGCLMCCVTSWRGTWQCGAVHGMAWCAAARGWPRDM